MTCVFICLHNKLTLEWDKRKKSCIQSWILVTRVMAGRDGCSTGVFRGGGTSPVRAFRYEVATVLFVLPLTLSRLCYKFRKVARPGLMLATAGAPRFSDLARRRRLVLERRAPPTSLLAPTGARHVSVCLTFEAPDRVGYIWSDAGRSPGESDVSWEGFLRKDECILWYCVCLRFLCVGAGGPSGPLGPSAPPGYPPHRCPQSWAP